MTYAFDPELAAAISMLPVLDVNDLPAARARGAELRAQLPAPVATGVHVVDRDAPGRDGDPDVTLRVYRPERQSAPAAIYHHHR